MPEAVKPIHFDFYDDLPKAQLDFAKDHPLPEEEEESEAPKTTVATQTQTVHPEESAAPQVLKTKTDTTSFAIESGFVEMLDNKATVLVEGAVAID